MHERARHVLEQHGVGHDVEHAAEILAALADLAPLREPGAERGSHRADERLQFFVRRGRTALVVREVKASGL